MDVQDPATIHAAVQRLAEALDPRALGNQLGDLLMREIPEFAERADEDLRQDVRAAAVTSLVEVWDGVCAGASPDEIAPAQLSISVAVELVHRGVELAALLRAYRLGHSMVNDAWERAANKILDDPELRWRALAQASHFFFTYVDAVCVQLTQAYADERARWVRGAAAVRAEMLQALLDGERIPVARASTALRYDVTARHIGFILWADPDEPDPGGAGALEGVAAAVAQTLGAGPSLLVPVGNWVVWGWAADAGAGDGPRPERVVLPRGVHVAVGDPADGLDGFVRTHQDARQTRRVASLLGRRSGATVRHRNVALLALLSSDPQAATRFVEAELGPLAGPDDSMALLRATLRVYFEENASPVRTSRRLSINKNTVVYRVDKAERILGHGVLERRQEVEAALCLAEVLDGLRAVMVRSTTGQGAQPEPRQLS